MMVKKTQESYYQYFFKTNVTQSFHIKVQKIGF